MSSILARLRTGHRGWPFECAFRLFGLALLAGSTWCGVTARRWIIAPPPHQATTGEFALCAAVVVLLSLGLAFTLEGPGLFRLVPIPRRTASF